MIITLLDIYLCKHVTANELLLSSRLLNDHGGLRVSRLQRVQRNCYNVSRKQVNSFHIAYLILLLNNDRLTR